MTNGFFIFLIYLSIYHLCKYASVSQLVKLELQQLFLHLSFFLSEFMRTPCVEAGLIPPLIQLLNSTDQEILLQTGRALGNICYDSRK